MAFVRYVFFSLIVHPAIIIIVVVTPLIVGLFGYKQMHLSLTALAAILPKMVLSCLLFFGWLMSKALLQQAEKPRVCVTTLTSNSISEATPDKTRTIEWNQIRSVRNFRGDLMIWTAGDDIFIPKTAFASPEHATEVFNIILAATRGDV